LIVGQALRLPSASATDTVALQSRIAHNLSVSEFQFGGLPAVALAKAGEFVHVIRVIVIQISST
jgi:hypothetical protein